MSTVALILSDFVVFQFSYDVRVYESDPQKQRPIVNKSHGGTGCELLLRLGEEVLSSSY